MITHLFDLFPAFYNPNYHKLMKMPQTSPAPLPTSARYSIGTMMRLVKQTSGQNLYPASNMGQKS